MKAGIRNVIELSDSGFRINDGRYNDLLLFEKAA